MVLEIDFAPMALAQKTFTVGDKVSVTVTFKYKSGVPTTVALSAGPYYTNVLGQHLVDACVATVGVPLDAATAPTIKTATVDFNLVPKAQGGIENGTYGLKVWIENTGAVAAQDNVIVVAGNPGSFLDTFSAMMPMLLMVMMLGMMMPMMQGLGGGIEE